MIQLPESLLEVRLKTLSGEIDTELEKSIVVTLPVSPEICVKEAGVFSSLQTKKTSLAVVRSFEASMIKSKPERIRFALLSFT
jgi:hypothetical protein